MKKLLHYSFSTLSFVLLFLFTGSLKAQTTVLFSDNFEADTINSQAVGWELFGTSSIATVQYDSGTTNKMLRLNAGQTKATSYAGIKIQKTLAFGYGDLIFSYRVRTTKLALASNTTNCPSFNRIGLGGTVGVSNADNNTISTTTTISPMGLQGILRLPTGLVYKPTGNLTPNNNTWYKILLRISRISDTTISVTGTVKLGSNDSLIKSISGSIKTTTPTILMNQIIFDLQALYHYNYVDIDDISLTLPDVSPAASNLSINGTLAALQTITGLYTLTGTDTLGTKVQWLSSKSANGPFTVIPNAIKASYDITRNDIGKYLAFRVYPATASGYITGTPVTVVTPSPVAQHNGPALINSIRQTGSVAATSTIQVNYTYNSPTNIPEKGTFYTVYVSDSFNLGYYKKIATGVTTASKGISYSVDSSLIGKYLYIELLPQDSMGTYGLYSGWTAQTAVSGEILVLNTKYWQNGAMVNDFGINTGALTITTDIKNNNPQHDTTGRLIVQLLDGFGNVKDASISAGLFIGHHSTVTLTSIPLMIPDYHQGYSIKVIFTDSINKNSTLSTSEKIAEPEDINSVYQYFVGEAGDMTSGAYLWIPPNTKVVKGIMICINNNIERQIQEYSEVRKVAEKWGLASLILNTFRDSLLAPPNNLSFDFTRQIAAAKMDSIIHAFAVMSNHPELVNSPFIPMAHSAYMDFPFHVAMRDNTKCIAAIPIKSGVPNIYNYYKVGGSSSTPAPNNTMKDVPILFYAQGNLPETIDGMFKNGTGRMRPTTSSVGAGFTGIYRNDDGTGVYKPGMEYGGCLKDIYEGHFNAMPRALHIVAMFIDKACAARLPDVYPTDPTVKPVLKSLDFTKGWLVDQNYFNAKTTGKYTAPAPYNSFTGNKKGTEWYFDEELARTCEQVATTDYFKKVEQFTILKLDGTPDTLFEAVYSYHKNDGIKFTDSTNTMRLKVSSFDKPWPIDTASANTKDSLKVPMKLSTKQLLDTNVTYLPITNLPVKTRCNASCYKDLGVDANGYINFKLRYTRFSASPGGYTQSYVSLYKEGNDTVAASLRNVRLDRTQSTLLGLKSQVITFPKVNNIDVNTRSITLNATASSGLQVEYFVRSGPAVIIGSQLVITQLDANAKFPVPITVGAYQIGTTGASTGIYAAGPVYQTIWMDNIAPVKPVLLSGIANDTNKITLSWNASADSLVNGYSIYRGDSLIAIVTDTTFKDSALQPNKGYVYYVRSLNKLGNYSDTTNNVTIFTPKPLPVQLKNFTAALISGNNVGCNWVTANEVNALSFVVERSIDGLVFSRVATVNAKGATVAAAYQLTDVLPTATVSVYYYRLKIIDKDGKYTYSKIVKVAVIDKGTIIKVAPNPFKSNLIIDITSASNSNASLMISSTDGRILITKKYTLQAGSNHLAVNNTVSLAKGYYLLTILMGEVVKTISIEKQ